jgi:hypothetical protein
MPKLFSMLLVVLVAGCARAQPAPTAVPESGAVLHVREALRLSGVAEEVAGGPMAALAVVGPDGATLVVAQWARWWVLPGGRIRPADDCAERLSRELLERTD